MYLDQLFLQVWLAFPLLLLLGLRIICTRWTQVPKTGISWGLLFFAFLLVIWRNGAKFTEVIFFPEYGGLLSSCGIVLIWYVYSHLCAEYGGSKTPYPYADPFLNGATCGALACAKIYKHQPRRLCCSFLGVLVSPIGLPLYLLFPCSWKLHVIGFIFGILMLMIVGTKSSKKAGWSNSWLVLIWLISYFLSWYALIFGVLGLLFVRIRARLDVVYEYVLPVYLCSIVACAGLLETLTRYFEGYTVYGPHDLQWELFLLSISLGGLLDPISSALIMVGVWDRMLDIQDLSLVEILLGASLMQFVYMFQVASCIWSGRRYMLCMAVIPIVFWFLIGGFS